MSDDTAKAAEVYAKECARLREERDAALALLSEAESRLEKAEAHVNLPSIIFDSYKVFKEAEAECPGLQANHVVHVLDVVARHARNEVRIPAAHAAPAAHRYQKPAAQAVADAPTRTEWFCDTCDRVLEPREVTFDERHDERAGGCGVYVGTIKVAERRDYRDDDVCIDDMIGGNS